MNIPFLSAVAGAIALVNLTVTITSILMRNSREKKNRDGGKDVEIKLPDGSIHHLSSNLEEKEIIGKIANAINGSEGSGARGAAYHG